MKSSYRIRVLGREITVKSAASQEHVREVETFVNRKLAEAEAMVSGGDPQVSLILALMNMAETCISLELEREENKRVSREVMNRLLHRIDSVV